MRHEAGSIPGVVESHRFGDGPPRLLIEIPHGATERGHYDALASRLESPLPDRLEEFFHVNTDFGAPELAFRIAELMVDSERKARAWKVVVIRALVPRTFVDFNREIEGIAASGMTPGLPPYITSAKDQALLLSLHEQYRLAVTKRYEEVVAAGGIAVALHSYSPRSVEVAVDADIVTSLRAAYRPRKYSGWVLRPPADFITADGQGVNLSPAALVADLRMRYRSMGLEAGENASYHLHPATLGYRFASAWPGRVLCAEFRRDLLGAPWRPFTASAVGARKVSRLAKPFAAALQRALASGTA